VQQGLKGTSSRKFRFGGIKGKPEGSAVTGKTGKPGVAETDLVSEEAAGHNNSSLTSGTASAANDEWELIQKNSSHFCFYIPLFQAPQERSLKSSV
jgi:hypothetical protein